MFVIRDLHILLPSKITSRLTQAKSNMLVLIVVRNLHILLPSKGTSRPTQAKSDMLVLIVVWDPSEAHVNTHTGVKRYACDKRFTQSGTMKRPIVIHTVE
jgi:hypothetical protein